MNTLLINVRDFSVGEPDDKPLFSVLNEVVEATGCCFISVWADLRVNHGAKQNDSEERLLIVSTYPKAWIKRYAVCGYARLDPNLKKGGSSKALYVPSRDHDLSDEERNFFDDAKAHGVDGFFVSVGANQAENNSVTTMVFKDAAHFSTADPIQLREHANAILVAAMERMVGHDPGASITARERECLSWAAMGKTDDEIASILGIRRWTVVAHFQSIKTKLGVVNRAAATAKAIQLHITSLNKF